MSSGYRYILRYYIDPGFHKDERITELVRLCRDGKIAEVMFFHDPEELFQGYPPEKEYDKWIALAGKVQSALRESGVAMSVNPWVTTVHLARGRKLPPGMTFRRMVGENGAVSPITACPLCPRRQEFLCSRFAVLVAGSLQDSSISNVMNHNPAVPAVVCRSGRENMKNVSIRNDF